MKVSVITPTWQRHRLLLDRCIPSVAAQMFDGEVEHIVVCDGPDETLRALVPGTVRFVEMPEHPDIPNNFGTRCRNHGLDLADGDLIAYIDDDNAWRPKHLAVLVDALQTSGADFAYSRMIRHGCGDDIIGSQPPRPGAVDTSLLLHRRGLPYWPLPDSNLADWNTVSTWLANGHTWVHVPETTVDYYFRGMS